jgi:hypothetical protein
MNVRCPCICLFLLVIVYSTTAATYYSIANGNWTNTSIWSTTQNGPACGCYPQGSDNVTVSHTVTLNKSLTNGYSSLGGLSGALNIPASGHLNGSGDINMDVLSQGGLVVCGKLTIKDIEFYNGSTFHFCSGSQIQVNGNFINRNNSPNIVVDGTVNITGSFENGTGAVITGMGGFVVTNGPALNNGSLFSCIGQYPCNSFPCYISSWCGVSTVLPVEWTSFTVRNVSEGRLLEWSTGSERNSESFEIQVSHDGIDFYTLSRVPAAGNSSQSIRYEFLDSSPLVESGYYRLKQNDFDGEFMYSEIISFSVPGGELFHVFPNPLISDAIMVTLHPGSGDEWRLTVVDALGRQVASSQGVMEGSDPLSLAIRLPDEIGQGCFSVQATFGAVHVSERLLVDRK